MEAPKRLNYPTRQLGIHASQERIWKSSDFLHRTDAQRPQPCLASTQALRSRRVSSSAKLLGGCDPGGQTAPLGRLDQPWWSDRPSWAVQPSWVAAPPRRVFGLDFVAQPCNPVVF
jgi:hypothetical protein